MRRSFMVLATATIVAAAPAAASAQDLSQYLERSAQAEFSGSEAVMCSTPDGRREVIVDLVQAGGRLSAFRSEAGGRVAVSGGTLEVTRPDGTADATSVAANQLRGTGGYAIVDRGADQLIGRFVTRVTVSDGRGVERASLAFDLDTGALLASTVLNDDGSVYCETYMISFSDSAESLPDSGVGLTGLLEPVAEDDEMTARLPESVADFRRLDVYLWTDGGAIAYYSDGLFSFSLLATSRSIELEAEGATEVEDGDGSYTRWFGPGQVVLAWDAVEGGLALSGDLPVDMIDGVLSELPDPARPGLFTRMWRRLFG
jgi:hypothetical protein